MISLLSACKAFFTSDLLGYTYLSSNYNMMSKIFFVSIELRGLKLR